MSHKATAWAIAQRGLKPATKIVLWCLADRHNPDHGCFPSLDLIAEDCEMSRRSVQDHISVLVERGLVRVEKMPRARGKLPANRYILGFEGDNRQQQVRPLAKSALGKPARSPLANSRAHLGQNSPTNLVKEPIKEPARERGAAPPPNKCGAPPRDTNRCPDRQRRLGELFSDFQKIARHNDGQP